MWSNYSLYVFLQCAMRILDEQHETDDITQVDVDIVKGMCNLYNEYHILLLFMIY